MNTSFVLFYFIYLFNSNLGASENALGTIFLYFFYFFVWCLSPLRQNISVIWYEAAPLHQYTEISPKHILYVDTHCFSTRVNVVVRQGPKPLRYAQIFADTPKL